MFGYIQTENTL